MSEDNFVWSDEIVCEFFRTHYINCLEKSAPYGTMDAVNKFKASKTSVKDYEVLSLIGRESNQLYYSQENNKMWLNSNKNGFAHDFDKNGLEGTGCKIHCVKRLSDGETFCIGNNEKNGIIAEFKVMAQSLMYRIEGSIAWTNIEYAKKSKPILFTTSDNVPIYDNTVYYKLWRNHGWTYTKYYASENDEYPVDYTIDCFSSEDAIKEYRLFNKPVLSIEDFKQWYKKHYAYNKVDEGFITILKQLAKSKLNQ